MSYLDSILMGGHQGIIQSGNMEGTGCCLLANIIYDSHLIQ